MNEWTSTVVPPSPDEGEHPIYFFKRYNVDHDLGVFVAGTSLVLSFLDEDDKVHRIILPEEAKKELIEVLNREA